MSKEESSPKRDIFLEDKLKEYRERAKRNNELLDIKSVKDKSKLYVFHLLEEKGKLKNGWKELLYSRKTSSPVEWAMIEDLKMLTSILEENKLI